ncbi:MAG: YcaO-like family protein [Micromonosporaceae bacterium]
MYGAHGMGCYPVRGIALLRAITEAAQARLTLISGARDNTTRREYVLAMEPELWRRQAAVLEGEAVRDFRTVPSFDSDSFDADVAWELVLPARRASVRRSWSTSPARSSASQW